MNRASTRSLAALLAVLAAAALAACDASTTSTDTTVDTLDVPSEAGDDVPGDLPPDAPKDVAPDTHPDVPTEIPPADVADVPPADVPEDGVIADVNLDAPPPPLLAPDEIGYESVTAPWAGSVIYFNTWSQDGTKDEIRMIRPDGSQQAVRLRATRVWAFGVDADGRIAFSSADPKKDLNYPDLVNWYDVIQYTFLVRPGDAPVQVSNGRVNDECHVFLPDGNTLLMCRRANLYRVGNDFFNDPYRILTLDLTTLHETWLSPLVQYQMDLNAAPRDDGTLLFARQWADTQESALFSMNADGSNPVQEREGGYRPVLSTDGKTAWFKVSGSSAWWKAPSHQLGAGTVVALNGGKPVDSVTPSPDDTQVAYEVSDAASNCTDLYVSAIDGSNPHQVIDCDADHDNVYIAGVRWVQSTVEPPADPGPEAVPEVAPEPVPEAAADVPDVPQDVAPDAPDVPVDAVADVADPA